ncbi:uncharacterized protein MELLADRAFT_108147 [Melampsora larici-populina 98AG31]|uniref:Uncharacterized protein n=1 Tax=Melampsora larici-populina (strain 98AG31 / pathotype 3-4-7) TaxID=747676 RepID=F4RS43_MELLP|nr:uncharacterized protein MELLADRAFT_108147 [Melampsora larici-populina 98AG31]EGG04788.1 hypothetical protein MELLADRAFT_108147 [Melampsora larici-populina 98AG31]
MSLIDYRLSSILSYADQDLFNDHDHTPPLSPSHSNFTTPSNHSAIFDSNSLKFLSSPPLPPPNFSLPPIPSPTQLSSNHTISTTSSIQQTQPFNLKPNSSLQATALLNTLNRRPTHQPTQPHHHHSSNSISTPTLMTKPNECDFSFLNQSSSSSSTPITSTPPPTTFLQSTDFLSGSPAPSSTPHQISLLQSLSSDPDHKLPHSTLRQITNLDQITQTLHSNHVSPTLSPISSIQAQVPILNPQSDPLIPMSSPSSSNQLPSHPHQTEIISPDQTELSRTTDRFINPGSGPLSPRNAEPIQSSSQLPQDPTQSQNQTLTPSSTLAAQTPGSTTTVPDPIPRPITTTYMAINFLNELKTQETTQPIIEADHPTRIINQNMISSSHSPQSITISTSSANYESLYRSDSKIIPITLFPSVFKFSNGKKVAVDGFISYATKVGRIRVIDQISGARMLLRKHEGVVIDMSIGKAHEGKRWRCIGSIGSDRRLVIWKVPNRFEEETANYEVLVDLILKDDHLKFVNLKWHPKESSVFLVSTNDKRIVLVRLDRAGFLGMWKRGIGMGRTISEIEGFDGQEIIHTNSHVVGFCFSPDGSAFAYVTEDGLITVRETLKPHWTIMGGQLSGTKPITKIEFLTSVQSQKPIGFLISRDSGRILEIVSLSSISKAKVQIEFLVPEDLGSESECFGDSNWLGQDSTILVSNSLRGSIYGFKLRVKEDEDEENDQMKKSEGGQLGGKLEEDSVYIEGRRHQPSEERMFVERIAEISTPDPIISFVIDEGSMKNRSIEGISTFNIHPKGIHQLFLPHDFLRFEGSKDQIEDHLEEHQGGMSRRKSLAVGKSREHDGFLDGSSALVGHATHVNQIDETSLKRLEESLVERMGKMFMSQVNQLENKFEKEKIEEKIMENERQMNLIGLISNSLEINLKKVLKEMIVNEIERKVLPEILNLVQETIKKEIHQLLSSPSPPTPLPGPSINIPIPTQAPTTTIPRMTNQDPKLNENIRSYEDIFLSALSNESSLRIDELIEVYELEEVFKFPAPGAGLSQPVLLTLSHLLTHTLSQRDRMGRVLDLVCDGLLEFKNRFDQSIKFHQDQDRRGGYDDDDHHHHGNDSIGIDEVLKLVIEKKNRLRVIQT